MKEKQIKEFETLLESIKTPSNLTLEQQAQLLQPISDVLENMLPSRLYRFRQCSERHIDAFFRDQVWVSRGIDMNDDYDTCLYYDQKKISDWLEPLNDANVYLKIYDFLKACENMPDFLKGITPDAEKRYEAIRRCSQEDIRELTNRFREHIKNCLPERLAEITTLIQQGVKFACFSENINSAMMWGHYAQSGTGFAVAYDFRNGAFNNCPECTKLGNECMYPMLCHIYPVIYKDKRYDATEYAIYMFQNWLLSDILGKYGLPNMSQWINLVLPCPDNSLVSKIAIHKSSEWKPEKEWRLFCTNNRPEFFAEAHASMLKKPVAVYLGRKISVINEKIIKDIAKEKGIECYKMQIDNRTSKYRLKPVKQEL